MILTLPFPPSVNTYYRRGANSTYMSKGGREYKKQVADIISDLGINGFNASRLKVMLIINAPNKRAYDLDNRFKAVLDSLQDAGVFDDDEQIDNLSIMRGEIIKGGKLLVLIEEITDAKAEDQDKG